MADATRQLQGPEWHDIRHPAIRPPGTSSTETTRIPRVVFEQAGAALLDAGVDMSAMRLPQVHDTVKQGLVPYLVAHTWAKGVSAYVGDGANRWPAVNATRATATSTGRSLGLRWPPGVVMAASSLAQAAQASRRRPSLP